MNSEMAISSMNLKEKMLFVCIGQGGGNIGQLLEDKGYHCLFINTAHADLSTLNVRHKLHIVGAYGCNKDRSKAIEYLGRSYEIITHGINTRFPDQSIIYFIFTLGGGTGSGLSPALLHMLSENDPHKKYNAICVIPSLKERSRISKINAIESYQQLVKIESVRSIMVLDNNNSNSIKDINKRFVDRLDRAINITIPDHRGIIDQSEIETVLTAKGSTYISVTMPTANKNHQKIALDIVNNVNINVFTSFSSVDMRTSKCEYLVASFKDCYGGSRVTDDDLLLDDHEDDKEYNELEGLEQLFGMPNDSFIGYNPACNLVIASGLPYPTERIKELAQNVREELTEKKERMTTVPLNKEDEGIMGSSGSNNVDNIADIMDIAGDLRETSSELMGGLKRSNRGVRERSGESDTHQIMDPIYSDWQEIEVDKSWQLGEMNDGKSRGSSKNTTNRGSRKMVDMSKILEDYR